LSYDAFTACDIAVRPMSRPIQAVITTKRCWKHQRARADMILEFLSVRFLIVRVLAPGVAGLP
jgi:hypothetical protein